MDRRLRIGLVGAGAQMTDCLYPALSSVDDVVISGVCDVVPERARSLATWLTESDSFTDVEEMIARSAPDALVAACPPEGHEEVILRGLASGVPVFVEKPPAGSLASLEKLAAEARRQELVTGVGMNFRYTTAYVTLKETLESGAHGTPVSVNVTHVANKPRSSLWGRDLLGSVLLAQSVHPVDLVLDLLGDAEEADSVERQVGDRLSLAIHLRSSSGTLGSIVVATGAQRFHFRIEVVTDHGAVLSSTDLMDVTLRPADTTGDVGLRVLWSAGPLDRGHKRSGYVGELAAFCAAARSGAAFAPAVPDLLQTYSVMSGIGRGCLV